MSLWRRKTVFAIMILAVISLSGGGAQGQVEVAPAHSETASSILLTAVVESRVAAPDDPQILDIFGQREYAAYRNQLYRRSSGESAWAVIALVSGLDEIQQVLEVREGLVFVYGSKGNDHYVYSVEGQTVKRIYDFRPGVGILRHGWMVTNDGSIFIAEYSVAATDVVPYLDVLVSKDGTHFKQTLRFSRGRQGIRHIHFIQEDPYELGVFYLGTGDSENESRLFVSRDHGANWTELSRGHSSIAVSLGFTEKFIYWGTDTPFEQTWIYRMDKRTRGIYRIQAIPGTAYWTQILKSGVMLVFTTVEPKSTLWDSKARIFLSTDGTTFHEVFAMESNGQGYGRLNPTHDLTDGSLYVQCIGLKDCTHGYLRIKLGSATGR
jgi:hypothetical protein